MGTPVQPPDGYELYPMGETDRYMLDLYRFDTAQPGQRKIYCSQMFTHEGIKNLAPIAMLAYLQRAMGPKTFGEFLAQVQTPGEHSEITEESGSHGEMIEVMGMRVDDIYALWREVVRREALEDGADND